MRNNVIFLDCTQNYLYQFSAANTKIEYIARGLKEQNDSCIIHNGIKGCRTLREDAIVDVSKVAKVYTYPASKTKNVFKLYKDLKRCRQENMNNVVVLCSPYIYIYMYYVIISRILGYKLAVISHEWAPTKENQGFLRNLLGNVYVSVFGYFVDGIFPISEYIIEKIRHFNKPSLKVPVLADYSKEPNSDSIRENNFVYCVFAAYKRSIIFIIDAYKIFHDRNKIMKLTLVLSGSSEQIQIISNYINEKGLSACVQIVTKLSHEQLINLYEKAQGLIVPLDPDNEQDKARFSQKIAEYLSTGTPIISSNVGEIKFYFSNYKNILLCEYTVESYANMLLWICQHQEEAIAIGFNGYELGKVLFNYSRYGRLIHDFLLNI